MKYWQNLLYLFLIGFVFTLITGCGTSSIDIVLSDEASIQKLNELVQDRVVRVTTKDSIYNGNNILVKKDSTIVKNFSTAKRVIPYSSMKSIKYAKDSHMLDGIIVLKNDKQLLAKNIYIANIDTVIKFDEIVTTSAIFPTSELIKIQLRDQSYSTYKGLEYGLLIGTGVGAILGTFVGDAEGDGVPDGSPQWGSRNERPPRSVIFAFSTTLGMVGGALLGTFTGAINVQWEDINIQFDKK